MENTEIQEEYANTDCKEKIEIIIITQVKLNLQHLGMMKPWWFTHFIVQFNMFSVITGAHFKK